MMRIKYILTDKLPVPICLISVISVLFPFFLFAQQSKIDSLLSLLKTDKEDTNKVIHLCQLTRKYDLTGDFEKGLIYGNDALALARKINFKNGIADASGDLGNIYLVQADYPKALDYYLKALKIDEELNNKKGIATRLGNIGLVYWNEADYPKALDYYLKALKIDETLGNKNGIARHLGNIGIVYCEQKDYPKALEYYFKAMKIHETLGNKNKIEIVLGNIGFAYQEQASAVSPDSAAYREQLFTKALDYYFKALKIEEELGAKFGMAINLGNIGHLYTEQKKYKEAEKYLVDALKIDKAIGSMDDERTNEEALAQLYSKTNRHQLALEHYKKAMALKDTVFSRENKKQLIRKEINYEFEKKEAVFKAEHDKEMAMAETVSQKKNFIIYLLAGMSVILCLIVLTVILFYRQNKLKATQKALKMEQKLLRLQMNPHFIFNSLAAVQGFINTDRKNEAGIYLSKISKLIRAILENSREEYIPFEKELQCLENYLTVNQLLMDNKFEYKIEVDERIDREQITIPPMIVQPFIENALKHGIQNKREKGFIFIRFKKNNQSLLFEVEDNGIGLIKTEVENEPKHLSLATIITKERLANLRRVSLDKIKINIYEVKNSIGAVSGTKVIFEIPVKYS